MKTTWILLGALGAMSICGALAQQAKDPFADDPAGHGGAEGDPFGSEPRPENTKFDFTFPGGTLKEFSNLIEHSNSALRIIVPDDVADAPVPSMHFKQVNFSELHELVSTATRRTDSQIHFDGVSNGRWVAQAAIKKEPRELAIFPVTALIKGRSVDDLMAVIEQAFFVAGKQPLPKFHLHEETKVLMASLTRSEAEIVKRLFEVLEQPAVEDDVALRNKRETVKMELDQLRHELTVKNTTFLEMQKSAADIPSKSKESIEHEVQVRMMRNEITLIEKEILGYMELLNRLRARELGLSNDLAPARAAGAERANPFAR